MDKQEELQKSKKYSTQSIGCAACIMASGARIVGVKREKESDKFLTFVFEADFDMEAIALEFASKTLKANAADLLDAYGRMKSIIHSSPR